MAEISVAFSQNIAASQNTHFHTNWCGVCAGKELWGEKKDENVILLCKLMVWYNQPEIFSYASMLVSLLMPICATCMYSMLICFKHALDSTRTVSESRNCNRMKDRGVLIAAPTCFFLWSRGSPWFQGGTLACLSWTGSRWKCTAAKSVSKWRLETLHQNENFLPNAFVCLFVCLLGGGVCFSFK